MSNEPIIYGKPEPLAAKDIGLVRYSEELHFDPDKFNILCKDGRVSVGPHEFGYHFDGTASDDTLWDGYCDHWFNKGAVHPNDWYWDEERRSFIEMATLSYEDYLIASMSALRVTIYETAP